MSRILIIDEENVSVRGTKYNIETRIPNTDIRSCDTCSNGLQELSLNQYDLIILDMMLPAGDWPVKVERADNLYGIELLSEIRMRYINTPVICYTVIDSEDIREKVTKLFSDYICKTGENDPYELIDRVKFILKSKR